MKDERASFKQNMPVNCMVNSMVTTFVAAG